MRWRVGCKSVSYVEGVVEEGVVCKGAKRTEKVTRHTEKVTQKRVSHTQRVKQRVTHTSFPPGRLTFLTVGSNVAKRRLSAYT